MTLTTTQRKKVSSGRISDAADVMLEQSLHLIKCILLKHETAQLEVMADMQVRIATLEQQNAELVRVAEGIEHRKRLRGFYVPEDTTDLLEALSKVKQP